MHPLLPTLPAELAPLAEMAMDLRWSGCRDAGEIWSRLDPETWRRTHSALLVLSGASDECLAAAAADPLVRAAIDDWRRARSADDPASASPPDDGRLPADPAGRPPIAYFSMEFALDESLPIYSGGLGVLAGDHLKSASDHGLPLVGIGLLFQHGSFRQELAEDGTQLEARPYNDASSLPLRRLRDAAGRAIRPTVALPGRTLFLRTWIVRVGSVRLLLLDANDPMNGPRDRAITAELYAADPELRLQQELVLGLGGWRLLERLGLEPEVCHLNEGHAAFAVVARAAAFARRHGVGFEVGLRATRAGNVFTTHTPVAAAFDRFPESLVERFGRPAMEAMGVDPRAVLRLGRGDGPRPMFEMARLALHGAGHVNAVSRLHGAVSRRLFAPMFPRMPECEVPVGHVTNGIDVRTWIGPAAQSLWREVDGLPRWRRGGAAATIDLAGTPDERLWSMRQDARRQLVRFVRERMGRWARERGAPEDVARRFDAALDPDVLTIGLARRFTDYKRTTLLLHDRDRLRRLLLDPHRPVQLLVAGKAHPRDDGGRAMVREMVRFAAEPDVAHRVVFLPDHDMGVAAHLVAGVDVWLNTPRRPAEACGTSGMKVLANGGLNCSVRDGWWDEAWDLDAGWTIGGAAERGPEHDAADAERLLDLLEREVVPLFHDRDERGLPVRWLAHVRRSMERLTPRFDSHRMVEDYRDEIYAVAASAWHARTAAADRTAARLEAWVERHRAAMPTVSVRSSQVAPWHGDDGRPGWWFTAEIDPGDADPAELSAELYADPPATGDAAAAGPIVVGLSPLDADSAARSGPFRVAGAVTTDRPAGDFTVRVRPTPPPGLLEVERPGIAWAAAPAGAMPADLVAAAAH